MYVCKVEQSSDAILIFLVSTKIRFNKENGIFVVSYFILNAKKMFVST